MENLHNEPTLENPIETYISPMIGWEWRVLEKYSDTYWYCAVQSPMTHGTWDFGGVNPSDIKEYGGFIKPEDYKHAEVDDIMYQLQAIANKRREEAS